MNHFYSIHYLKIEFSTNQIAATKAVEPNKRLNFTSIYFREWSCSPSISIVLMARNVPAEMDRKMA